MMRILFGAVFAVFAIFAVGCASGGSAGVSVGALGEPSLDDFDSPVLETQLYANVDQWGAEGLVLSAGAEVNLAPNAGPDGSTAIRYDFTAVVDSLDLGRWQDAYLAHNAGMETSRAPAGFNAIAFDLRPQGFSFAKVLLGQAYPDGSFSTYSTYLNLIDDEWQTALLPFELLAPADAAVPLRSDLPVNVQVFVPVPDNFHRFHYRDGIAGGGELALASSLLIDNLRFVAAATPPDNVVADFEDPEPLLLIVAELQQTGMFYDYSADDNGVVRTTPGVTGQYLRTERVDGGPEGAFLRVSGGISIDADIREFLDTGNKFGLSLALATATSWQAGSQMTFLIRSPSFSETTLIYDDNEHERSFYSHAIGVSGIWTRIRLPFSSFDHDGASPAAPWTNWPTLRFKFELAPAAVEHAIASGVYEFVLEVDSLLIE
jgi:hypothetical protein